MNPSISGTKVKECRIAMLVILEIMESLPSFGNYASRDFPSVLTGIKLIPSFQKNRMMESTAFQIVSQFMIKIFRRG